MKTNTKRLPHWLKKNISCGENFNFAKNIIQQSNLNTICIEAKCPNKGECFSLKEMTFIIGGRICSRNCLYCNVETNISSDNQNFIIDNEEHIRIAKAIKKLDLNYAVITSVTMDWLYDGGAMLFYNTVKEIKKTSPKTKIELLVPDFKGSINSLNIISDTDSHVIGHNIEVASKKLFLKLRPMGNYNISLDVLSQFSKRINYVKSGFMLGFGESREDIIETIKDLNSVGVKIVTIGQYLPPSNKHTPVVKYYTPDEFLEFENIVKEIGIKYVKAGPFVRSSYKAGEIFE